MVRMIPRTPARLHTQTENWQQILADSIDDPLSLCRALDLDPARLDYFPAEDSRFRMRVPRAWLELMEPGNHRDPLLLQVLATVEEERVQPGYSADPVGDLASQAVPGLLHKYQGRALIVTTGACAIHCRYCFRRHFPYQSSMARDSHWPAILDYLHSHRDIGEVILSGGDPLGLGNGRLSGMFAGLEAIPHLHTLRLHSRAPVVLPERMDPELFALLTRGRLRRVLILHVNHPRELQALSVDTLQPLRQAGVTLLNQSVLIKGVNDSIEVLAELSHSLFEHGILPCYLHQLDPVSGAHLFQVSDSEAKLLQTGLAERVPGYLLPRLVREQAGAPGKTPVI